MTFALVITAAGSSTRMSTGGKKEYRSLEADNANNESLGRISILSSALHAFLSTYNFSTIIITVPENGEAMARSILSEDFRIEPLIRSSKTTLKFTEGGSTRQESVFKALNKLLVLPTPDAVLIHDGARPWIRQNTITDVINLVTEKGAGVPGIPSVDTQKEIDDTGKIIRHLDRSHIISVQTPQGFLFGPLLESHKKASKDGKTYTDDTEIWARYYGDVYVCPGDYSNKKVTFEGDL